MDHILQTFIANSYYKRSAFNSEVENNLIVKNLNWSKRNKLKSENCKKFNKKNVIQIVKSINLYIFLKNGSAISKKDWEIMKNYK